MLCSKDRARKHNFLYIGFDDSIGNIPAAAEFFYRVKVHALKAQIQSYALQMKLFGIVALQVFKGKKQHHGVLAAGHANGYAVALLYHIVVVHTAAHKP